MIYLEHTTDEQMVYIPKTARNSDVGVFIKLFSTMNLVGMVKDVVIVEESFAYYLVQVKLPSVVAPGEYEYEVGDIKGTLSSGIAVVGEKDKVIEYNNAVIYEQYN